jgi:hypothetical protein
MISHRIAFGLVVLMTVGACRSESAPKREPFNHRAITLHCQKAYLAYKSAVEKYAGFAATSSCPASDAAPCQETGAKDLPLGWAERDDVDRALGEDLEFCVQVVTSNAARQVELHQKILGLRARFIKSKATPTEVSRAVLDLTTLANEIKLAVEEADRADRAAK